MKWTLLVVLLTAFICSAQAQLHTKKSVGAISADPAINIAAEKVNKIYIAPPAGFSRLKSAGSIESAETKIEVEYINFPEDAKRAFEYAVSIWKSMITSPMPIKIQAKWDNLQGNVLALSRPSTFHVNFDGAPLSNVYYPVSLAEKLSGKDMNNEDPDIICSFSNKFNWYFGTDGKTPSNAYDFVSSVLHEITHGLGVSGFLKNESGTGYFDNNNNLPSIYDYHIFNALNQQISDKSLFNSPSTELHGQLISDELKFFEPGENHGQGETVDWLYAPSTWRDGASIYHLKGSGYDNGLMTPYASKGAAIHHPGDNVLRILSEMGWKSVTFNFVALKDMEDPRAEIPVEIAIMSDVDIDSSSVKVIFSTDYFSTSKSSLLTFNESVNKFTGTISTDFHMGNVQYYFTAKAADNQSFNMPAQAPEKKFSVRIGPDYAAPQLVHNPERIIYTGKPVLDLSVFAHDNIGISSVKIEYKIDGIIQDPVNLDSYREDAYKGQIQLPNKYLNSDHIEYRIVAEDKSTKGNIKILPANGFYKVNVVRNQMALEQYSTNFEENASDFALADFSVSALSGFSSGILHTSSPYPVSALENENCNLIAQLLYPIVLKENGEMTFDEVVLVEPGEALSSYTDRLFWDYVIVEASKDDGSNWLPLTNGYDSGSDDLWYSEFTSGLKNNVSATNASENMFLKQSINLTEHPELNAGDTILIRFRLASDKSVNGWGWAIDNLEIQKSFAATDNGFLAENNVNVFPNPFIDGFFVDCSDASGQPDIAIEVTDLTGKTVYRTTGINPSYNPKVKVELPWSEPGIYLVNISNGNSVISTNKMIKN